MHTPNHVTQLEKKHRQHGKVKKDTAGKVKSTEDSIVEDISMKMRKHENEKLKTENRQTNNKNVTPNTLNFFSSPTTNFSKTTKKMKNDHVLACRSINITSSSEDKNIQCPICLFSFNALQCNDIFINQHIDQCLKQKYTMK